MNMEDFNKESVPQMYLIECLMHFFGVKRIFDSLRCRDKFVRDI